ncbi:MAG: DNA primase [Myxococcota bacterium]
MGRIPDETIDTIRDRSDLVDLIGRHLTLKKSGSSYKGLCPFHDEKTPSFHVQPERRVFHCFGCGAGGDVFEFLMRHDNLTFREAAESAARDCGVEIPVSDGGEPGRMQGLVEANQLAQDFFVSSLFAPEGAPARTYLKGRGLDGETCRRLGIGFAVDRWDGVVKLLRAAGIPEQIGEQAGLIKLRRSGGHYDHLRGRITFPIQDPRGRVIAFGGRALDDQEPKYLNTPESPLFRKRESFYGFPASLEAMRRRERAVVVEGYFDRIALERAGVEESVATCGTALGADHARQLRRRTGNVVLLFDGDAAGQRAMEAALEVLLPTGLRVHAVVLPAGDDPDSLLTREGADALRTLVDAAQPALDAVIRRSVDRGIATPFEKADAVARVVPLLARLPGLVERREFSHRLARLAAVDTRDVEAEVRQARGEGAEPESLARPSAELGRELHFVRRVARVLLAHPRLAGQLLPGEPGTLVEEPVSRQVTEVVVEACRSRVSLEIAELARPLGVAERSLLLELACSDAEPGEARAAAAILKDTLEHLRRRRAAKERRATTRKLADAQDPLELLREKQRQLEARRAAQGLEPTPAPGGGVELLR